MAEKRRIIRTKEDDDGIWDLVAYNDDDLTDNTGFWRKREEEWKYEARVPLACRACGRLLGKWDTQFIHRYGVCAECNVDWLEGRDLSHLKSNEERLAYCKSKIEEKNAQRKDKP